LEIRVSLSWVISGCFIEDVVEADLPDSAFATACVSDDHPPKLLGTAAEHRGSLSEQRVTGGAAQKSVLLTPTT